MADAFVIEEDNALKTRLTGLTVIDEKNVARPVNVWFGQPDLELRARTFPYISIELIDINEAQDRVVSGIPILTYQPGNFQAPVAPNVLLASSFPSPYDLDYQISVWSRHPRHDRQLMQELLQGRLPIRFGRLVLPQTNRSVRMDMLGGPRVADGTDENGKRIFRKVFTVRVSTELFNPQALSINGLVARLNILGPSAPAPKATFTPITATIP